MAGAMKHSRQRDAILNMLHSRCDHPTAEQLYTDLKDDFPRLSLGTVYRNLALLERLGEVIRISADGHCDRFDGTVGTHYHFACECCGSVDDVPIPVELKLEDDAQRALGARIKRHSTVFFGICKNCLKKS